MRVLYLEEELPYKGTYSIWMRSCLIRVRTLSG